jgi:hypothetical protein
LSDSNVQHRDPRQFEQSALSAARATNHHRIGDIQHQPIRSAVMRLAQPGESDALSRVRGGVMT